MAGKYMHCGFGRVVDQRRPKPDAEARMFKNTPLEGAIANEDPNRNPLWLTPEQMDERHRIMREVKAWEDSTSCGIDDYKVTVYGFTHRAFDFCEWQKKKAYCMLADAADINHVAVEVFREPSWVIALKSEFNL